MASPMRWTALWSENWGALLVLAVVLTASVSVQLADLKHPTTARRVLDDRLPTLLPGGPRRPSEEDALLFAAGRRVQRDWRAWVALFVPSFVTCAGAMIGGDVWASQIAPHWLMFAAVVLCYGLAGAAYDPIRRLFLAAELARPES